MLDSMGQASTSTVQGWLDMPRKGPGFAIPRAEPWLSQANVGKKGGSGLVRCPVSAYKGSTRRMRPCENTSGD